jgi:poly-gamma-glutamate synthesis protein (capsule biosynthesis protein)
MRRSPLALLIVSGPALALTIGFWLTRDVYRNLPVDLPPNGPITIALAGDVLLTGSLGDVEGDAGFAALRSVIRGAHFAAANLEMNLLDAAPPPPAGPRWPYGGDREAESLRMLGFDAFALANDHAGDYGSDGTLATIRGLGRRGLLHAGAGADLAGARAATYAGVPTTGTSLSKRRLAFISVAASSMPAARATEARADIAGRPGVSPLRYTADITVDANTYQTLKNSVAVFNAGPPPGESELLMFGTPIKKGDRTSVEFIADPADERAVLEEIKAARATAEVVIVSVHAHEPSNASDAPADFIKRFARAAIDSGAVIIVGHGPHRLRGIETYGAGVIFYSLGNFLYRAAGLDFRAANLFDAGADLYQAAVGAQDGRPTASLTPPADPEWWEGIVALLTMDRERLVGVRLVPVDLGARKLQSEKGMPRRAGGEHARDILTRLERLSQLPDGILIEGDSGFVRGISPNQSAR